MGGLEVFNRTYIHIHPAIYFETEKFLWTFNRPGEYYAWVPFNTKLRARVKITPREERHLFSRGVIFTHARFLLPLLSLRKNGDYSKSGMNSTTTYL